MRGRRRTPIGERSLEVQHRGRNEWTNAFLGFLTQAGILESDTREEAESAGIEIRLWDPKEQLRFAKKESVPPRPDGAPNRWPDEAAA